MTARNSTAARPTARQLAYLASLVERAGLTQEQWRESVGLYETSPWGRRLRAEMITRASVSAWIGQLKGGLSHG
jgi:hypothetical protein